MSTDYEDCGISFKLIFDGAGSEETSALLMGALVAELVSDPKVTFAMDECRPLLETPRGKPPRFGARVTFLADGHTNTVWWIQYCWRPDLEHSFMTLLPETRTDKAAVPAVWRRLVSVVEQYARTVEIAIGVGAARLDEPNGMEVPLDTPAVQSGEIVMPWTYWGSLASQARYRRFIDACPSVAKPIGTGVAVRPVRLPGAAPRPGFLTAIAKADLRYLDPLVQTPLQPS